ncbi:MAG: iron-containing alcohol dehydrogenase [Candidatus Faecousia sp.]|nr:iron-containing alcohol dehydrogenase [Candidatus Faecousia sp.]
MFFLKAAYCRIFQGAFRLALPVLPYREPEIIGGCADLVPVMEKEHIRCPLIVTDRGIVKHGLVAPLTDILERHGFRWGIYDRTQPNPTVDNVEQALNMYRELGCDSLIAIGGGSSMDCAKAVGARVVYPNKTLNQMRGVLRVLRRLPTLIAIPTTAGTGSETTLAAVITDAPRKYAMMSFPLIPRYAVLDGKLTCSLPPQLTATTGMDALTHAVEAYIGRSTTAQTRRLALEAVELVFTNLKTAYSQGDNLEAREKMLLAAYKAGIAFSKSYVGYVHAVAHSLGGKYNTPHGLANAVILPYVLERYGSCIHGKLFDLGVAAGVCRESDDVHQGAKAFLQAVWELNRELGIPRKLPGIQKEDIPPLARHGEKEANPLYPVPRLMSQRELEEIYYDIADWSDST